jgi:hypothetical protein
VATLTGWIQPADVTRATGLAPHSTADAGRLTLICQGLNRAVGQWRPDLPVPTLDGDFDPATFAPAFDSHDGLTVTGWDPRITLGLVSLAQRMYSGLGTGGAEQYDPDVGLPPVMSREIETLLEINRAFRPVAT